MNIDIEKQIPKYRGFLLKNLGKKASVIRCNLHGTIFKGFSFWVSVVPGDPSVSSSRLQGARLEMSTSCVLRKLSGAMFIVHLLTVGVSPFTTQPEERTGQK